MTRKNLRTKKGSDWLVVAALAGTLGLAGFSGCTSTGLMPLSVSSNAETGEKEELRRAVAQFIRDGSSDSGVSEEVFSTDEKINTYADFLMEFSLKKGVPAKDSALPIAMLVIAYAQEQDDAIDAALGSYSDIVYLFPDSDFAAEALYRQGVIYSARRQFPTAFDCFSALEDAYPASPRVDDAIVQAYLVTEMVRKGVRPLKGGWLPWFKDRTLALDYYDRLYAMAPHLPISPRLLYHKGKLAFDLSREWFSFDKTLDAIDALERMISIYPDAKFVPDAYLELAKTYEAGVVGADWDQLSTRRAINYYTDFYSLFPEHRLAEYAYEKTVKLTNLLAENRLVFGDFYYSRHNNLRAALTFYNEAVTLAPDSPASKIAQERIERIRRGERSERTLVDWIFGRYPNYDAVDYLDAPSQKPLDEMGFRNGRAVSAETGSAGTSESAATDGFQNPGEN
ncbi:MAG: outer membrane protein assembly factor BamD [Opitutales bacterium]|nr:outer membrane protein assembly factor BamD [Opitutales bacterium]